MSNFSTGNQKIDNLLGSGIPNGGLLMINGKANSGKTMLTEAMVTNIKRPVIYFSIEQDRVKFTETDKNDFVFVRGRTIEEVQAVMAEIWKVGFSGIIILEDAERLFCYDEITKFNNWIDWFIVPDGSGTSKLKLNNSSVIVTINGDDCTGSTSRMFEVASIVVNMEIIIGGTKAIVVKNNNAECRTMNIENN